MILAYDDENMSYDSLDDFLLKAEEIIIDTLEIDEEFYLSVGEALINDWEV